MTLTLHRSRAGRWGGVVLGLGVTSVSLSSGFIWAYQGRAVPVFAAAFFAWAGYLFAHYATTGQFVDAGDADDSPLDVDDPSADADDSPVDASGILPDSAWHTAGIVGGALVLIAGMVVGVVYIRAENHLLTNVGGVLFLGGYVVAHYADTGTLL